MSNFKIQGTRPPASRYRRPCFKGNLQEYCTTVTSVLDTESSPAGGSGARPPYLKSVAPFHVWTPGCCIHPILYLNNVIPFVVFGPPCCEILVLTVPMSMLQ